MSLPLRSTKQTRRTTLESLTRMRRVGCDFQRGHFSELHHRPRSISSSYSAPAGATCSLQSCHTAASTRASKADGIAQINLSQACLRRQLGARVGLVVPCLRRQSLKTSLRHLPPRRKQERHAGRLRQAPKPFPVRDTRP